MKKKQSDGSYKEYPPESDVRRSGKDWVVWNVGDYTEPNLICDCGSDNFKVCYWDYDYAGGYCRVVCSNCGRDLVLIDECA